MAVRRAVRQQVAVTAKLNMTDGIRGGITVDEALTTARWLQDDGGHRLRSSPPRSNHRCAGASG